MPPVAQPRQLTLETPLGPGALTLVGLTGHEAISQLFAFQLELVAPNTTPVPFDQLVGKPVTAGLGGGRFVHGMVSRFSAGGQDGRSAFYRAEVVPWLWLLTRRSRSRTFQEKSVPEIAKLVLDDSAVEASFALEHSYSKRNYCVQHNESDFDFISRLLEDEGIWYRFEQTPSGHTLVIGDASATAPDVGTVPFDQRNPKRVDPARVLSWEKTQELTPGKVTLRDHNFELPQSTLEGTATIQQSVQVGQVTHQLRLPGSEGLERYDYPGGYADRFDGIDSNGGSRPGELQKLAQAPAQVAALRMQEEAARAVVVGGTSTCRALAAGSAFALAGHGDGDGRYLLTGVQHSAWQPLGATGEGGLSYENTLTAIPATMPYRPPRTTPLPVVNGPQTAIVVGPAGTQTYTDRHGRVKVQFHWDREGNADENSSCWIRVAQPVGGAHPDFFWLPEVGDEVVVAFEHGDPDRPYVLGRVFNPGDTPPDNQ